MTALATALKAVGLTKDDNVAALGPQLIREERALNRHLTQLRATPLTVAQHFGAEPLDHGIDFARFDALLGDAQRMLKRDPDAGFQYEIEWHALDAVLENLASAMRTADPYRRHARP